MWRATLLTALVLFAEPITTSVFSEGGRIGSDLQDYQPVDPDLNYEDALRTVYEQRLADQEQALNQQAAYEEHIAEIVDELRRNKAQEQENEQRLQAELHLKHVAKNPHDENIEIELQPAASSMTDQPMVAQKKGQSEFVSFVEPVAAAHTKNIPALEKRRLAQSNNSRKYSPQGDSNLIMMAVGCILVVGTVGAAVGGGVYFRRRRETPDDGDYAPYAGTGPFKKTQTGDKGDESLAYKAQLHHYQQAKQKIICGDDAPGVGMESDEEENADDENNFSVYECPGLAPTGDIEVHNPNFGHQP